MKLNNINDIDKYDKIDLEVDTVYDLIKYDKQLILLGQRLNSLKAINENFNIIIDNNDKALFIHYLLCNLQFIKDTKKQAHIATMPDYSKKKPFRMRIIKH